MKLQIISDVHLEFQKEVPFIPVKADIIILLGDIGYPFSKSYQFLIEDLSKRFKHVIIIAGNHEYYNSEFYTTNDKIEKIAKKYQNVHFLNNSRITIDNITFYGATLWTHIPKSEIDDVLEECNDYSQIRINSEGITRNILPQETTEFHKKTVKLFRKYVTPQDVVLTHHAPIIDPRVFLENDDTNPHWVATDLKGFKPKLWAYGHTHKSADFTKNGTRYYSNPIADDYSPSNYEKVIEI